MNFADHFITQENFDQVADRIAVRHVSMAPDTTSDKGTVLFRGDLRLRRVTEGIFACFHRVTAVRPSQHIVVVPRGLYVTIPIGVGNASYSTGGHAIPMQTNRATVIKVASAIDVAGIYHESNVENGLVIQLRPEMMMDDTLAEQVDSLLRETALSGQSLPDGLQAALAARCRAGPESSIQNLLFDSSIFEVIARSLDYGGNGHAVVSNRVTRKTQARMARVRDLLVASPERMHRLADLAKEAGVSVTGLKAQFVTVYGESVFAFLRTHRLELAKRGIECDGWTVSEAAFNVGYGHPGNFSIAFRRHFGYPPSSAARRGADTLPQLD